MEQEWIGPPGGCHMEKAKVARGAFGSTSTAHVFSSAKLGFHGNSRCTAEKLIKERSYHRQDEGLADAKREIFDLC